MEIGKRIKALRIQVSMTQEELGEKLGVKKAAVQKYENGSIVNLKVDTINKLAEIFEVSPSFIMGWDKFDKNLDSNKIQKEIMLAELIGEIFKEDERDLIYKACELNKEGKRKLFSYMNDLTQLEKYMD